MVTWILNKVSRILSSAGVIVCWLVLDYYSTQCGLLWPRNWNCLKNLMFNQLLCQMILLHLWWHTAFYLRAESVLNAVPCYMLSYTHLLSFSILMTIFPSGTALASTRTCPLWILLELGMMEVVMTAGANRCANCKAAVKWSPQQTNTSYLQFRCPSCHPTNSVKAQLQLTVIYIDDKPNSCDICSARITTNKMVHSACKSVDV